MKKGPEAVDASYGEVHLAIDAFCHPNSGELDGTIRGEWGWWGWEGGRGGGGEYVEKGVDCGEIEGESGWMCGVMGKYRGESGWLNFFPFLFFQLSRPLV